MYNSFSKNDNDIDNNINYIIVLSQEIIKLLTMLFFMFSK